MGIDIKKGEFLITKIYEFYENEKNSYFLRNLLKNIQQYNTDIKIIEY